MMATAALEKWILEPLQKVVGARLLGCRYGVLSSDAGTLDVERPNETGPCQVVALTFDSGSVLVTWDFREPAFRDDTTAFHLSVTWFAATPGGPGPDAAELFADLVYREATHTPGWSALVGGLLQGTAVWGRKLENPVVWGQALPEDRWSPQGVTFSFSSRAVHLVLGMGPDWIGDGDEVLVFGGAARFPPEGSSLISQHVFAVVGEGSDAVVCAGTGGGERVRRQAE